MTDFENAWVSVDEAAKVLNCSPEGIEILINGMTMVATKQDGGTLINLKGIGDFIKKVQEIAGQLMLTPVGSSEKKTKIVWIRAKEAAKLIPLRYDLFVDLCQKRIIPAQKRALGWRVEENELKEFISSNQELIKSLKEGSQSVSEEKKDLIIDKTVNANPAPLPSTVSPGPPQSLDEKIVKENPSPKILEPKTVPTLEKETIPEKEKSPPLVAHKCNMRGRRHNGLYCCRIDDVAQALKKTEERVRAWIKEEKIKSFEATENQRITWYVEQESLRSFLLEECNIQVTFNNY